MDAVGVIGGGGGLGRRVLANLPARENAESGSSSAGGDGAGSVRAGSGGFDVFDPRGDDNLPPWEKYASGSSCWNPYDPEVGDTQGVLHLNSNDEGEDDDDDDESLPSLGENVDSGSEVGSDWWRLGKHGVAYEERGDSLPPWENAERGSVSSCWPCWVEDAGGFKPTGLGLLDPLPD